MKTNKKNRQLDGEVNLVLRNAETLEIEHEITKKNKITETVVELVTKNFVSIWERSGTRNFDGNNCQQSYRISVSENKVVPDGNLYYIPNLIRGDTLLEGPIFVEDVVDYLQIKYRFNQPTLDRTLNSVFLLPVSTSNVTLASVLLNEPCIQTTSQILDVTYRIFFHFNEEDINPNEKIGYFASERLFYKYFRNYNSGYPKVLQASSFNFNNLSYSDQINGLRTDSLTLSTTKAIASGSYYKSKFNRSLSKTDFVGVLLKTVTIGYSTTAPYWANMFPDDSQYIPVNPIHNHLDNSPTPFLNVDYLANGSGYPNINGDNWTPDNPDMNYLYSININKTGNVGVSNYSFTKRPFFGFNGDNYDSRLMYHPIVFGDLIDSHGFTDAQNNKTGIFDNENHQIYSFDDTGVIIVDVVSMKIQRLDTNSYPSINLTAVKQVSVDSSKNMYIADAVVGLYKVTNVFQATDPIFTLYDSSHADIPSDSCYAVDIGYNDAVCAIFDGALCISEDNGATFTQYNEGTTPDLNISGVTDNNWSNITYMAVSQYHIDQRMVIKPSNSDNFYWWSKTTSASAFSNSSSMTYQQYNEITNVDGYWFGYNNTDNSRNFYVFIYKFNTTEGSRRGNRADYNNKNKLRGMAKITDYYGSLYFFGLGGDANYGNYSECRSLYYNTDIDELQNTIASNMGWTQCVKPYILNNWIGIITNIESVSSSYSAIYQLTPNRSSRSLRNNYSVFGETLHKYHYNPNTTVFERNYYTDALDTSGNNRHAKRHNFDTESQLFTGRSMIDITDVFPTNTFDGVNNGLTFCCTYTPSGKLNKIYHSSVDFQEIDETLFELHLNNGDDTVKLYWRSGNNITINDQINNQTVAATPVNDVTYRIVCTILNDQVLVYLDGVLQNTITLTNPIFNLSKSGAINDTLSVALGCKKYHRDVYIDNYIKYAPTDFIRGELKNVQIWNIVFDQTDVTNDMVDIYGVINSKNPTTYLQMRYELNQDLTGLETKPTHLAQEALDEGLTIAFEEGQSGDSFVATDYYTAAITDGILKDNATQFDINNVNVYHYPANLNVTNVTDPLPIGENVETAKFNVLNGTRAKKEGSVYGNYNYADNWNNGAKSVQSVDGDFELIFSKSNPSAQGVIGMSTDLTTSTALDKTNIIYGFEFTESAGNQYDPSNFHIYESDTPTIGDKFEIGTYVVKDSFKIKRVGHDVTYYKYNIIDENWDLLYQTLEPYRFDDNGVVWERQGEIAEQWVINNTYSVNDTIRPSNTNGNGRTYICTVSGTSHATTEPNWSTALNNGDTIVDNDITWTCQGEYANVWQVSQAYITNDLIRPTIDNSGLEYEGHVFKCVTSGTSNTTEPTWLSGSENDVSTLRIQVNNYRKYYGYYNIQMTYDLPTNGLYKCIGYKNSPLPENSTGKYKERFRLIDTVDSNTLFVKIDGVNATIVYDNNNCLHSLISPSAAGEVVINKQLAIIKLHPDDSTKTITGSFPCIYSYNM